MTAVDEFARELLTAARAAPGRVPPSLLAMLDGTGAEQDERARSLDAVREAQLVNDRQRRRAAELEALFSTASELVRLQDVDAVLRRLVDRAHDLMGTDVTYLSEYEPASDDMRVQFSAGTVTPEFRNLQVPAGIGLTSLVASTREAAWVARYDAMDDAPHGESIDQAVIAEGLVSFLGVPLIAGDEVLGALFACNRFAHDYSPDEVLLLQAFADHAAAVLQNARLLAAAGEARERAEDAYRELEQHLRATEMASAVHEELTNAVVSGGTVLDVVATLAERLDRRVFALDQNGHVLGSDGVAPRAALLRPAIAASQASGHVSSVQIDGGGWLVSAILGADRVLGAIIAEDGGDLADDVAERTLERAAHVAALVSLKREAVTAIQDEHRARWLLATLDSRADSEALIVPPEHLTGCAVIGFGAVRAATAAGIVARAVGDRGFVAQREGVIIVAWTIPDVLDATERARRVLSDALREPDVSAVVRVRELAPSDLAAAVAKTVRDAALLPALGVTGTTVSSDAFAPYHALAPGDPATTDAFIQDLLGRVITWDAKRGTELFDTLIAFFDGGESRPATAAALHIHTNTVQQRLERIQALLDGDMSDPEFRFRLQAATRLEHLRRRLRAV
ncbi:MAG: helix-turn-helix domain-containing protein [Microbacterium sp.]